MPWALRWKYETGWLSWKCTINSSVTKQRNIFKPNNKNMQISGMIRLFVVKRDSVIEARKLRRRYLLGYCLGSDLPVPRIDWIWKLKDEPDAPQVRRAYESERASVIDFAYDTNWTGLRNWTAWLACFTLAALPSPLRPSPRLAKPRRASPSSHLCSSWYFWESATETEKTWLNRHTHAIARSRACLYIWGQAEYIFLSI